MGRGLSRLQWYILSQSSQRSCLYYVDICEGYFGWKPRYPVARFGQGHYLNDHRKATGEPVSPGAQHFSRQEIGEHQYRAVMATLSRAVKRLDRRGLVTWISGIYAHYSGVQITEQGRAYLSVNLKAASATS